MSVNDKPVQRNFLLPADQAEWLRQHAFLTRRKQAEVVREALSEYQARAEAIADSTTGRARHRALVDRFSRGIGVDLDVLRDDGHQMWSLDT